MKYMISIITNHMKSENVMLDNTSLQQIQDAIYFWRSKKNFLPQTPIKIAHDRSSKVWNHKRGQKTGEVQ